MCSTLMQIPTGSSLGFPNRLMQGMADRFYDQLLEEHWAPIDKFGQPPAQLPNGPLPGDTLYPKGTQHRVW